MQFYRWVGSKVISEEGRFRKAKTGGVLAACGDALRWLLGLPCKACCGVRVGRQSWSKEDMTEGGHESFCLAMRWEGSHDRAGWEKDVEEASWRQLIPAGNASECSLQSMTPWGCCNHDFKPLLLEITCPCAYGPKVSTGFHESEVPHLGSRRLVIL